MIKNIYQTSIIKKIISETQQVKTLVLNSKIKAKPGQYLMIWIPRINEKPFGIAVADPLTISVANVGSFSKLIHNLKVGDKISFRGPYGTTFKTKGKKIAVIAGGYGVVPLYFLVSSFQKKLQSKTTVIIGAKTKKLLPYISKFNQLKCSLKLSTDDGSTGFKGFSTHLFKKTLSKEKFDQVYTCGPTIMMEKIAQICHDNKIPCQISFEAYFKCGGIGLCGECNYKGILTCKQGPVFSSKFLLK